MILQKLFLKQNKFHFQQGFTLIEFIVILIIFSIMASVALFNFNGFRNETSLTNLAHDLALTIRQAQVFGISATQSTGGSSTRGIFFEYDSGNAFTKSFVIFSDTGITQKLFDASDAVIDTITINSTDRVTGIEDQNGNFINRDLSITFTRPYPEATINDGNSPYYSHVIIHLASEDGRQKQVEVFENGQIRVSE